MLITLQDGGGLFKDFMENLIKQGFHQQYGLFTANAQVCVCACVFKSRSGNVSFASYTLAYLLS